MSSTEPITVCMPVANGARFLIPTLDALKAQTERNYRTIFCDGASDDRTVEIARSYGLDVREHADRLSYPAHFVRSLGYVRTDLCVWLAHDDIWHPTFLERMRAALTDDAVLAFCYAREVGPGNSVRRTAELDGLDGEYASDRLEQFDRKQVFEPYVWLIYGLMRTAVAQECLPVFDESNPRGDFAFIAAMLEHGKARITPEVLFLKRAKTAPGARDGERIGF